MDKFIVRTKKQSLEKCNAEAAGSKNDRDNGFNNAGTSTLLSGSFEQIVQAPGNVTDLHAFNPNKTSESTSTKIIQSSDSSSDSQSLEPPKKKKYCIKFREEWKATFPWLIKENSRQSKKCFVCNVSIFGGKSHLKRHENSDGHTKAWEISKITLKSSNYITHSEEFKLSESAKQIETALSIFIAEHNLPFTALNHLNHLLKRFVPDSKIIKKMSINRIKAQSIVKNVTGPANLESVVKIMNKQYYSIVIDESTDCTASKNLAIIARIFNVKSQDRFLGLVPLVDLTAQGIFDAISLFLSKNHINIKNMIGFTADNCSVMMGKLNGVQSKLKDLVPNLFVNGCVCHNLNLASKAAAMELPDYIDKLLIEINHHFCNSSSRKLEFRTFQKYFGSKLHVILRYAPTRWLSRQDAINRILEQWTTLLYYFELSDFETKYGNENIQFILSSLKSDSVKLYFYFLSYILNVINSVNLEMQSEEPRVHILVARFSHLFRQICRNFINKATIDKTSNKTINLHINHLSDNDLYCGSEAEIACQDMADDIIRDFKCKVRKFYIKFCEQLRSKIDFEYEVLTLIPKFTPEQVVSGQSNSVLKLVTVLFPQKEIENAEKINTEYRSLSDYEKVNKFKNCNISEFWHNVSLQKNELGEFMFANVYKIAQGILSLPHSSANVERIFSIQNLIKTKCRNRLAITTCEALIRTKDLLKASGSYCFNFPITKEMISRNVNDQLVEEELLVDEE